MTGKPRQSGGPTTAAEQLFAEALGQPRPFGRRSEEPTGPLDVRAEEHDPDNEIRGEFLTRLLVESSEVNGLRTWWRRGGRRPVVCVADAVITGVLDLRAVELPYLLEFVRCRFSDTPDLRQASLAGLEFAECRLPGVSARNVSTANDVSVTRCVSTDVLDLTDAQFGGSLTLNDSELRNPRERVIKADRLSVAGALLAMRLRVAGEIRIPGAKVTGNVTLAGSALRNRGRTALNATGTDIGGSLRCEHDRDTSKPFSAAGKLFLPSARIHGDLRMRGAILEPGGRLPRIDESADDDPVTAIMADRGDIRGDVRLDHCFSSSGTIRMVSCRIHGELRMGGAVIDLSSSRGPRDSVRSPLRALHLNGSEILGSIRASGAHLHGQLRAADLHIGGSFLLNRATLAGARTDVLRADRLRVGSDLACRDSDITGSLQLRDANIGSNLDLRATSLTKPAWHHYRQGYKPVLDIATAHIGRDLVCASGNRPWRAEGQVRLRRAVVGRQANFWHSVLGEEADRPSLHAFGLVAQELTLVPDEPPLGPVVLRQAQCELFGDNATLWQATDGLDIEGFSYENFSDPIKTTDRARVRERLDWLAAALERRYQPGPYDQLATVFRNNGNEEHATTVLVAKQRRRYQAIADASRPALRPSVRLWSLLQRVTVSYGYRPLRALLWLLLFAAAGTTWFTYHPLHPINEDDHPVWNPFLYTVDQLVPIVNLGHDVMWRATDNSEWITVVLIAAGWILATTVAAGVTRALRRDH